MQHARLSASKTKQWWICSGSVVYLESRPDLVRPSGIHAQLGQAAHSLSERCLREGSDPSDYMDRIIVLIDDSISILRPGAKTPKGTGKTWFVVDVDMAEAVEMLTTYVRGRCEELGVDQSALKLEQHVVPLPDRDDTGGTADIIIDAWPEVLEGVDYKHGAGVFVPVKNNHQLRSYLLGLAVKDKFVHELYRCTIVQPRHVEGGISYEELTRDELIAWAAELAEAAERVDAATVAFAKHKSPQKLYEEGFLSTGEDGSHCTFCDLSNECPAALARVTELAGADFAEEPEDLDTPGDNRLAVLLPWVPFVDKWLRGLEASSERLLMQGRSIEDDEGNRLFKLVRKRSTRKHASVIVLERDEDGVPRKTVEIEDDDQRADLIVDQGFIAGKKRDTMFKSDLKSGPQIEKLVPKNRRGNFSDQFLFKPEGGLTVAPESDPREAVTVDPAADFDEL